MRKIVLILLLLVVATLVHAQNPLTVGPGTVERMAAWEVASLSWKPWTMLGYGLVTQLYTGPGEVARLSYWNGTAWVAWDGTVPAAWLIGTPWTQWYTNGTGHISEVPLGLPGQFLTSTGPASAPIFNSDADSVYGTLHFQANWALRDTGGNARGISAVDLQLERLDPSHVSSGNYSVITGGYDNTNTGTRCFIGSGLTNLLSGTDGVLVGGEGNILNSSYGFLGGGRFNTQIGSYGALCGGTDNTDSADYNFIGGGQNNAIDYQCFNAEPVSWNGIASGRNNRIRGQYSFIGGGYGNQILQHDYLYGFARTYGFIGAGYENTNAGRWACGIVAGYRNFIDSTVANGFIGAGDQDSILSPGASTDDQFIIAGVANKVYNSHTCGILAGSQNMLNSSPRSLIGVGRYDSLNNSYCSAILSGTHCSIDDADSAFIGGGTLNRITTANADFGVIVGGQANRVTNKYGYIGGGRQNYAFGDSFNVVVGGYRDSIALGYGHYIGGGDQNVISGAAGINYFIGGGYGNLISVAGRYGHAIVGGYGNKIIQTNSYDNFIGSGRDINITGTGSGYNSVVGGYGNYIINSGYSFVGGGEGNKDSSNHSAVGGGLRNIIFARGHYAAIPGGDSNQVRDSLGVAFGRRAYAKHARSVVFNLHSTDSCSTAVKGQYVVNAPGGSTFDNSHLRSDSIFGYTNSQWTTPSFGITLSGAGAMDTNKIWSGDSIYVTKVYINIKTPGTVAGGDSFWIVNKAKTDSSARCFVAFGTTFAAFDINRAFPKDTLCMVVKMGGTTLPMRNYVINANYGTRKGKAW